MALRADTDELLLVEVDVVAASWAGYAATGPNLSRNRPGPRIGTFCRESDDRICALGDRFAAVMTAEVRVGIARIGRIDANAGQSLLFRYSW